MKKLELLILLLCCGSLSAMEQMTSSDYEVMNGSTAAVSPSTPDDALSVSSVQVHGSGRETSLSSLPGAAAPSVDDLLNQFSPDEDDELKQALRQELLALDGDDYRQLCDEVMTRGKSSTDRVLMLQMLKIQRERNKIEKAQLKSMEEDGVIAQKALEQQIASAKFYRRTTISASIVSGITTLWALGTTIWGIYAQTDEPSA